MSLLIELRQSGYREMGIQVESIIVDSSVEKFYIDVLNQKHASIVLAKEGDQLVGLAILLETPKIIDGENRLLIEEMVVREEKRGMGIGSKLLDYIEQIARDKNIHVIKVTTGTKLKANEFYKKQGYVYFENAYRKKL